MNFVNEFQIWWCCWFHSLTDYSLEVGQIGVDVDNDRNGRGTTTTIKIGSQRMQLMGNYSTLEFVLLTYHTIFVVYWSTTFICWFLQWNRSLRVLGHSTGSVTKPQIVFCLIFGKWPRCSTLAHFDGFNDVFEWSRDFLRNFFFQSNKIHNLCSIISVKSSHAISGDPISLFDSFDINMSISEVICLYLTLKWRYHMVVSF